MLLKCLSTKVGNERPVIVLIEKVIHFLYHQLYVTILRIKQLSNHVLHYILHLASLAVCGLIYNLQKTVGFILCDLKNIISINKLKLQLIMKKPWEKIKNLMYQICYFSSQNVRILSRGKLLFLTGNHIFIDDCSRRLIIIFLI
jgi:hypothetical protein